MAKKNELEKLGKGFDKIVADMIKLGGQYATADGNKKSQILKKLKKLTNDKKDIMHDMELAAAEADKDIQLQMDEVRQLIKNMIKETFHG